MRKFNKITTNAFFIILLATILTLTGCQNDSSTPTDETATKQAENGSKSEQQTEKVTIVLSENKGEKVLEEKVINIKKDAILMDVMQENFDLETDDKATFIIGIDGLKAKDGENKAWMYDVNGKEALIGASEYKLKDGDKVEFDFRKW